MFLYGHHRHYSRRRHRPSGWESHYISRLDYAFLMTIILRDKKYLRNFYIEVGIMGLKCFVFGLVRLWY